MAKPPPRLPAALAAPLIAAAALWAGAAPAQAATATVTPGTMWTDTAGNRLQAHGAGIFTVGSTYYIVGEDKVAGSTFTAVACYSSTDLVHWTRQANALSRQASGDLGPGRIVERPKVIYNSTTGKYVLWMHIDNTSYNDQRAGVAVSDTPCGPYNYLGATRPLGHPSRDLGLFKDDDGTAYMIHEDPAAGMRIERLAADYTTAQSTAATFPSLESPAMAKVGGRYFLLTSHLTGWNTNDNVYATATSPAGPWSGFTNFAPAGTRTYNSQTSSLVPVTGSAGTSYVYVGDRWNPGDLYSSLPVWLPITLTGTGTAALSWYPSWGVDTATGAVTLPAYSRLTGNQSGRCLDITGGAATNGATTQISDCTGGTGQRYTPTPESELRVFGTKCLQARNQGTSAGTAVEVWDCTGANQQKWMLSDDGTIVGVQSRLCLDVNGQATASGTRVQLWTCNGGANQQWSLSTTPTSTPTSGPPPTTVPPGDSLPCDIYAAGGTPCVAAHSTVRALVHAYAGNLYQVRRSSDNTTRDIGLLAPGGTADAATQDSFCAGTTCVITVVYDQSGRGNNMWYQGSAQVPGSPQSSPARATSESLTVGGSKAYSLYINPGNSYWRDGHLTGVPTGSAPEGMYMVTSGTHVNGGCCFDYGNSETTRSADTAGAMDAINFSTQCWFGGCQGGGPWVQADLEWGLYPGGSQSWNPNQRALPHKFVTAVLKNDGTSRFALKGSNAQSGSLTTMWDGSLPGGYSPMKKQGAIILGSGGDCCKPNGGANLSAGTFYEGAMVAGYPSDATENALQANIVAAGYR